MELKGFKRSDGRIGFRNHVIVIPITGCQSEIARRIADGIPGVTVLGNLHGCDMQGRDFELLGVMLEGFALHPNVGGVLFLAMGCAATLSLQLPRKAHESGRLVEVLNTQNAGTTATVEAGRAIVSRMAETLAATPRESVPFSGVTLGTKCGASDENSFSHCHPVVGRACDMLAGMGATIVLSGDCELLGGANELAKRAATPAIAARISALPETVNNGWRMRFGYSYEELVLKNRTREEWAVRSLAHAAKAGTGPINGFSDMGEKLHGPGIVILNGPNTDLESVTALAAAGCNATIFTTGRGTVVGSPAAITLKVTATSKTFERMQENIDLCVGGCVDGCETIDDAAKRTVETLVAALNGTFMKAERLGHWETAMPIRGVIY